MKRARANGARRVLLDVLAAVIAVVAFLASDEGHWVTGQTIEASGGYKL